MGKIKVDFSEIKEFFDKLVDKLGKEKTEKTRKPKFLLKNTYFARLNKLPGSKIFQNSIFEINGKEVDLTKNGSLSCAAVVSGFLFTFNNLARNFIWIKEIHLTVESTIADLKAHGWREINELKKGSVLVWEPKIQSDGKPHRHIGFYCGNNLAISNDSEGSYPVQHHCTFKEKRKIENIFWHPALNI
jgi:hypothetical protein